MAQYAVAEGIHAIVATPHAMGSSFQNSPEEIRQKVADLQSLLEAEGIPLRIYPGSEVQMCPDMAQRILAGEALFLCENNRYILIEFPFHTVPQRFHDEIYHLRLKGITPVIAHPERNPMILYENNILQELSAMGCLIQVNSTSITGGFGEDIMTCAHELLTSGLAHIIASDAHSVDKRPPALVRAVKIAEKILKNHNEVMELVWERPKKILNGQVIYLK